MKILPYAVIALLLVTVLFLCLKIRSLRRAAREISDAFADRLSEDTNVPVTLSSSDRVMRELASRINVQLHTLRARQIRYENGDRAVKEAVTNVSHDLRTPLTAISGYLDLLEKEEQSENARRYVRQIRGRAEAMKRMTEELFRYSAATSSPPRASQEIDLRRAVEESLLAFCGAFEGRGIVPSIRLPREAVLRTVDPFALSRIFGNVIENALKYSDGDFSVTLTENGTVRFSNTASRLSEVDVGRLFDRYFTVEATRLSGGLGLSIAKRLAEESGAEIRASYRGGSFEIEIRFPVQNIDRPRTDRNAPIPQPNAKKSDKFPTFP